MHDNVIENVTASTENIFAEFDKLANGFFRVSLLLFRTRLGGLCR